MIIDSAIRLAKFSDVDEANIMPEPASCIKNELDIFDPLLRNISSEEKIALARSAERTAFELDDRVRASEGAGVSSQILTTGIYNTKGFNRNYNETLSGLWLSPVAEGGGMQSGSVWHTSDRFFHRLESPEKVAEKAVSRTVRLLGARKIRTTEADIILDPVCGVTFLSDFFSLINGDQINRGLSCLKDERDRIVAPEFVSIIDDSSMPGKIGSRPFDGEGVVAEKNIVVENGILKKFLYDTKAAYRSNAVSTGNAHRRYDSEITIGTNNFYMENGDISPEQMIRKTERGFFVTQLMGFGFDPVTGQFSYGAAGIWIDRGEMSYPVHELVIAGNIRDMLKRIESVGNDLEFRGLFACPTFKISDVTIGGN